MYFPPKPDKEGEPNTPDKAFRQYVMEALGQG